MLGADFEEHHRRKWVSPLAGWHSDLTMHVNPPDLSILRAETTSTARIQHCTDSALHGFSTAP
ncbi:hypothetical protein [Streptomyces sp. NPDC001601]|uniref:hypothetical protein n=1 Tax=Streptomyces sp. NPDC001601 TaxID=3364592 RepID=UPI00369C832F